MIQGSCADLQKMAIAKLYKISREGPRFKFKFTVFDSFLIEVDESVANEEIEAVVNKMSDFSGVYPGMVLKYKYGVDTNWLDAYKQT